MALVALASTGLLAAGVVAVSQLASADRPDAVTVPAGATPSDESVGTPSPAPPTSAPAPPADDPEGDSSGDPGEATVDGQIVIQIGDGEPITIDLGELGDLEQLEDLDLGELDLGELDQLDLDRLQECLALFDIDFDVDFDLEIPPIGPLGGFGEGDVTIAGPDGVSVVDFGEGDGSVTISRTDGELTITSDGDVEVEQLADMFEDMSPGDMSPDDMFPGGMFPDADRIHDCLSERP